MVVCEAHNAVSRSWIKYGEAADTCLCGFLNKQIKMDFNGMLGNYFGPLFYSGIGNKYLLFFFLSTYIDRMDGKPRRSRVRPAEVNVTPVPLKFTIPLRSNARLIPPPQSVHSVENVQPAPFGFNF